MIYRAAGARQFVDQILVGGYDASPGDRRSVPAAVAAAALVGGGITAANTAAMPGSGNSAEAASQPAAGRPIPSATLASSQRLVTAEEFANMLDEAVARNPVKYPDLTELREKIRARQANSSDVQKD